MNGDVLVAKLENHHAETQADAPPSHDFLGDRHDRHARRTRWVLLLCAAMMVVELVAGAVFRSMALIADGLHMSTHAGVMFVAAAAYRFARQRARDASFSFGTGKVGDLAAFGSAVALGSTAAFISVESIGRLLAPVPIAFDEAIVVAVLGLGINLLSVWLLHDDNDGHDHGHVDHHARNYDHHSEDEDDHHHASAGHHDHNIRAAYLHVLSDTAVGLLAIAGLVLGRLFGWLWLDPVMGLVGAFVIARWALALVRATASVLLDRVPDAALAERIRQLIKHGGGRIVDLHVWRLGPGHNGVIASVKGLSDVVGCRARLAAIPTISHVTVEALDEARV
ncbi:CDF family Co(II)/Ni(II) efflux transporter DmeF [Sphingomonas bacterium]|uniref:CDF family Co(II)/Ni(II) efflux transporter DmeF n=1 Tax=Sphingomonas bacterium TaxID=1895847 RepID=UPI00157636B9|nr:CDF family Co(II)/Ni(II) efflux transporter DmeF [Sphingomonas bacterium]